MFEENPAEDGKEQPATSVGGPGAAAQVEVGDDGSGPDAEVDEYDGLLTSLGRTYDKDCRIAIHEAGATLSLRACAAMRWAVPPSIRVPATKAAYGASATWRRLRKAAATPPMFARFFLR
ncbi:hypothetical protein AB7645_43115 [Bradyrhizobium sp. 956_D2_N1_5]|jgi:hypothetical protein|uniref:hypothetical protein n=1 Tax=unclassified Bradyrhizobium TaxID=2631580 RepID=UPI003F2028DB